MNLDADFVRSDSSGAALEVVCGKAERLTEPRHVTATGPTRKVAIVELSDQTESLVEMQIWDDA